MLSKEAVLEGAGVVDLFFRDVEKYKNDPEFMKMMETKFGVGYVMKVLGDAANLIKQMFVGNPDVILNTGTIIPGTSTTIANTTTSKFVTTTKSTTTTRKNITTTKKVTMTTLKLTTTKKATTSTTKKQTTTTTKENINQCPYVYGGTGSLKVVLNEIAWMGSKNSFSDEWIEIKNVSGQRINISG
jgi:hypothetical protein